MEKKNKNPRNYNCKDEELPVIGGYVLTSIRRDQAKFEAYSPKYNNEGLSAFENEINAADELVNPKSETTELKLITNRLYATMDDIYDKARHVEGYVTMSKGAVPISAKDFGLTALKQRVKAKDAEGTLQNLRFVNANIAKYKTELAAQGLTNELEQFFADAVGSISADNRTQYDMVNNRKAIVQANLDMLNGLYDQIREICIIGKILFRGNAEKLKEYTFIELKKRVRNISKPGNKGEKQTE